MAAIKTLFHQNYRHPAIVGAALGLGLSLGYAVALPVFLFVWLTLNLDSGRLVFGGYAAYKIIWFLSTIDRFILVIKLLVAVGVIPAILLGAIAGFAINFVVNLKSYHLTHSKKLGFGILTAIVILIPVIIFGALYFDRAPIIVSTIGYIIPCVIYLAAMIWLTHNLLSTKFKTLNSVQ